MNDPFPQVLVAREDVFRLTDLVVRIDRIDETYIYLKKVNRNFFASLPDGLGNYDGSGAASPLSPPPAANRPAAPTAQVAALRIPLIGFTPIFISVSVAKQ